MGEVKNRGSSILYILTLFLTTRLLLTVIGVVARAVFGVVLSPLRASHTWWWAYLSHRPLIDIWGVADTEWYVDIARHGYAATAVNGQANYAFFPLYPVLMAALGRVVGDPFLAGVVLSNAALAVACVLLYRLVRLDSDDGVAVRSAKYLLLFPTSFVLSGVLSESLYLALLLGCFDAARRRRWPVVGALGFLLSLTRSIGVLVLLPMLYEYHATATDSGASRRNALYLLLIPCGAALFAVYQYHLTGDPLAYLHIQAGWKTAYGTNGVSSGAIAPAVVMDRIVRWLFVGIFVLGAFAYLVLSWRALRVSYWLVGVYTVLLPVIAGGPAALWSAPRFLAEAFPLYILLAKTSVRSLRTDETLAPLLAATQGFLMTLWTNGANLPL